MYGRSDSDAPVTQPIDPASNGFNCILAYAGSAFRFDYSSTQLDDWQIGEQ